MFGGIKKESSVEACEYFGAGDTANDKVDSSSLWQLFGSDRSIWEPKEIQKNRGCLYLFENIQCETS